MGNLSSRLQLQQLSMPPTLVTMVVVFMKTADVARPTLTPTASGLLTTRLQLLVMDMSQEKTTGWSRILGVADGETMDTLRSREDLVIAVLEDNMLSNHTVQSTNLEETFK